MLWLGQVFSDQRWEIHQILGDGDLMRQLGVMPERPGAPVAAG